MGMPRAVWPLLFHPFNGEFPADEAQLTTLCGQIRQQGHIAEHTHAGPRDLREGFDRSSRGHHWADYDTSDQSYLTVDTASCSWPTLDTAYGWPSGASSSSFYGGPQSQQQQSVVDDDGYECCPHCDSYLYEDEFNGDDTETEDEGWLTEQDPADVQAYLGSFEGETYEGLRQAYLLAKRRFRHFAKRSPRHQRYPRRSWSMSWKRGGNARHAGKGRRHYFDDPSVVGPSSLAGGKGFAGGRGRGKGRGKKGRGGHFYNPIGADGQRMLCHECQSDEHLVANCPERRKGGKGRGRGSFLTDSAADSARPAAHPAAMAGLFSGVVNGANGNYFIGEEKYLSRGATWNTDVTR